tara:strand:+ start:244 stop:516 length:273 start_codon:yes stop_codon:yes gene_type:complete
MPSKRSVIDSFQSNNKSSGGNYRTDGQSLFLFGNEIAKHQDGKIAITLAGWNRNTTKQALNCISGCRVCTIKGKLTLNQKPINDDQWYLL